MGSLDMQPMTCSKLPLQSYQPLKKSKKLIFNFFKEKICLWASQRHKTKYSISIPCSESYTILNRGVCQGSVNFFPEVCKEI